VFWAVAEVKRERGVFSSRAYRKERWDKQLRNYVTADTVYAIFIDPITVVVLRPDGSEIKVVEVDKHSAEELLSPAAEWSLSSLTCDNSVSETSLTSFKDGETPSRYLDVSDDAQRRKFYDALRVSARELIDFSSSRLSQLDAQYAKYQSELNELESKVAGVKNSREVDATKKAFKAQYKDAIEMFESTLKEFEGQIGRQMPKSREEAQKFIENIYATEGSSLVLARILFVRFFEDYGMTIRKISNGGIKAFREYHLHIKDDYQYLLTDAYREAEHVYKRLFEPSIFDWSHKGDGQLSKLLLRIFYRLNAFDFTKITGDILGNLYERFLDIDKRKKLGEYYTPLPIAQYVLERIGFFDDPGPLLDPGCGSGTFLIAATTGLIQRLTDRGVELDVAIQQVVSLIHGLDINMFAAFTAQLQMIWHLLPSLVKANAKELPDLRIYGGVNSLEWLGQETLISSLIDLQPEDATRARAAKYKYVVGNPPYIRNERLKDTGPWRDNYDEIDFRNSDVSYFFIARALIGKENVMPSWLDKGGKMCFVLPRAVADSDAASALREILLHYKIFEVTDLEDIAIHIFPSPQASGRATVAPILLFVEEAPPGKDNNVEVVIVPESSYLVHGMSHSGLDRNRVPQDLFRVSPINPYGQILTEAKGDDLPILKKLMSSRLSDYAAYGTPSYGVKVGSGKLLHPRPAEGLRPIAKGLNVCTFYVNPDVNNWVDLNTVESKSIWGGELAEAAYVLSGIALAPQCAPFSPKDIVFNNSTLVFVPKPEYIEFPWDTLINSSVVRFVHLLTLRTALVGVGTSIGDGRRAAWCTLYPRSIAVYPVPQPLVEDPKAIVAVTSDLRTCSAEVARRWKKVEDGLSSAQKKPLSMLKVDFHGWQLDLYEGLELRLEKGPDGGWILRPYDEDQALLAHLGGARELLKVVKFMVDGFESPPTAREMQQLLAPENYKELCALIERAEDPQSPDITRFQKLHKKADELIAAGFCLNDRELDYVRSRLSSRPLDVLQPRWPWKAVERRNIQEYTADRFG
jgi:type I restriction-modification system DNA methylase subunit